jgi:small subunit ribosomal protein S4
MTGGAPAAVEIARGMRPPAGARRKRGTVTKRLNAKYKIDRRVQENIWGRPKSPFNKRETPPGMHGAQRKAKISDYGIQLRAKQKLKGYYGNISERQFEKTYNDAISMRGNSAENLIGLLESRLDAVVYRAKFVPTVFASRQFINHGHVKVNGRRTNIPSYRCKVGDVVEIQDKSKNMALVLEALQSPERDIPDYVEVDPKKMTATYLRVPGLAEVPYAARMEPNLVVEFYSS